jgi:iron complex transport system ATP-binding protein
MAAIEVKDLCFSYRDRRVLENLSFEAAEGSFLAIAGPNGSGKTTLVNLLCGQLKAPRGSVRIDSTLVEDYRAEALARKVAVVRQEFVPAFGFSAAETVMMARTPFYGTGGFESRTDRAAAEDALRATDTIDLAGRSIRSLSSGERQRVFIARALAQETPTLLLDEPTSFLDLRHQVEILDVLKAAQLEKGKTVVVVTHDINLAWQYCDDALLLGPGGSYRCGPQREVFSGRLIEEVFNVRGFMGGVGEGGFFLPLGRMARDFKAAAGS